MKTGCITCVDEQNNVVNGVQDKLNADYITKTNCPSHITTSEEATSSVRRYLQQYNDNNSRINDLINIKRNLIDSTDTYLTSLSYHYEVNSTYYIICLVHNIICDLPMSLNDFSLNLKNFTDSLDTNDKLKIINSNRNELSFTNYTSINNLTNITIIDDKTVPDINQIKILSSNYSMNGTFYIELRSPEPIVCHWQINLYNKEKILMFGNKPTCYYSIMCGTIIVGPTTGGVIEHNPSYLIPFSKGVLYNVWIQCMNDIPLSQSISEPFAIMSIYQQDDCPYNNCTTSNSTSSSKGIMVRLLRISLFILLIGYFV